MKPVDVEAASRLLGGTAFNAALWVADSDEPQIVLPKAMEAFRLMAEGFLASRALTAIMRSIAGPTFRHNSGNFQETVKLQAVAESGRKQPNTKCTEWIKSRAALARFRSCAEMAR